MDANSHTCPPLVRGPGIQQIVGRKVDEDSNTKEKVDAVGRLFTNAIPRLLKTCAKQSFRKCRPEVEKQKARQNLGVI